VKKAALAACGSVPIGFEGDFDLDEERDFHRQFASLNASFPF
jgi:hypothetical protein